MRERGGWVREVGGLRHRYKAWDKGEGGGWLDRLRCGCKGKVETGMGVE